MAGRPSTPVPPPQSGDWDRDYDTDTTAAGDEEESRDIMKRIESYDEKKEEERRLYPNWLHRQSRKVGRGIKAFIKGFFGTIWYTIRSIFKLVWAALLICLFLPIVIVMWIPWTWFPSTAPTIYIAYRVFDKKTREVRKDEKGNEVVRYKKKKMHYDAMEDEDRIGELSDCFAWYSHGTEQNAPGDERSKYFWKTRPWELYELIRASWRTIHRQGLQIAGVLSGITIAACHGLMMWHDFRSPAIGAFLDSYYGGQFPDDPHALLTQGDELCAYVVGTGIANWASNLQNLVWFGLYHTFIILLCFMLIADEALNVRMGLFAPQWSRMGTGYTVIFLVSATLCVSPNWGSLYTIRATYALLVAILLFGLYNVLRGLLVGVNLGHHTYANMTYRNRRHALRPWTEREWQKSKKRQDFRQRKQGDIPRGLESLQLAVGDHCWQYQKIDRKKWNYGQKQEAAQKVYRKTAGETKLEGGRAHRKFVHGLPIRLPKPTKQDMIDIQRYSTYKGWRAYYGVHSWHPWKRWDSPKDEKERANFNWEKQQWRFERTMTFYFDLRRIFACMCAIGAFAIHIGLLCDVMGLGHWQGYRSTYTSALAEWKANDGEPSEDKCQYYPNTHLAIYPQPGVDDIRGVSNNMFWLGLWHVFMLGMCVGVFLVAFSNNRVFGMHLPWPVTLIGPRCSSNGIGWTLGFIAWGTLSLGFFSSQPQVLLFITKTILYCCLVCWVLYLAPNENLGNNFIRDPFWDTLSQRAFIHMDSKKFHREVYDFAAY